MNELLFEIGISNAIISAAIAVGALAVGKLFNRPHLAYFVWLLVLVKLVMPSIVGIPMPSQAVTTFNEKPAAAATIVDQPSLTKSNVPAANESSDQNSGYWTSLRTTLLSYLPFIWAIGIVLALFWSLFRVVRFDRLLRAGSVEASDSVNSSAMELAGTLGLKKLPKLFETTAEISPMVWWVGGKVRVYIPTRLVESMDPRKLRMVLAHELAHVKRKDYLVRWLEWTAGIIFWWNPIVWLAQRNLRAYEEICCDNLILASLKPTPHHYASSLLSAVEEFAGPALRPPSMASEVNSGGYLIRRIHMILSKENDRKISNWTRLFVIGLALFVLPLGFVNGQDSEVTKEIEKTRERLKTEVEAGTKSKQEAMAEMAQLKTEIAYRRAEEKINMAVAEGKISPEDAAAKLASIKERGKENAKRAVEKRLAIEEVEHALKKGQISKDEAKARMLELRMKYSQLEKESSLKRAAEKLQVAVSLNKISAKEAEDQLAALNHKLAAAEKNRAVALQVEKLEYALEAGKISREEADLRMRELERRHVEGKIKSDLTRAAAKLKALVQSNEISTAEADAKMRSLKQQYSDAENVFRLNSAAEKLRYAVEAGKISEAEAKLKYEELGLNFNRQKMRADLERAAAKVQAAAEAGAISNEDAKKKLTEIKKALESTNN